MTASLLQLPKFAHDTDRQAPASSTARHYAALPELTFQAVRQELDRWEFETLTSMANAPVHVLGELRELRSMLEDEVNR